MVRAAAILVMLLLAALQPAGAADPMRAEPAPASVRTYVVGVEELDYLPYYGTVDGQVDGAIRDLLDAFAADSGYRFVYRPMPILRLFAALERGDIDFKFPENPLWTHPEKQAIALSYSRPLLLATDAAFVLPDRLGRTAAEIRSLGKILGFDLPFWSRRPNPPELFTVQSVDSLLMIGLAGRVDAVHANVAVMEEVLRRRGREGALIRDPGLPTIDYDYRLGTARHPDLLRKLDDWIAANPDRFRAISDERRVTSPAS